MGFFKNLSGKIERWLLSDEIKKINEQEKVQQNQPVQLTEEDIKLLENVHKAQEYVDEQLKIILNEDLTINPTQADINRYYNYHTQYVQWVEMAQKKQNMWSTNEIKLMEKSDFDTNGRIYGWDFLRKSCGFPLGNLNKIEENKSWNVE